MRHDVSVTGCPSTQTDSESPFELELHPFLPFIFRDCDANACFMRHNLSVTVSHPTLPYPTIPYHTMPDSTLPYHSIPYHTIPYPIKPHPTLPNPTPPYPVPNSTWQQLLDRNVKWFRGRLVLKVHTFFAPLNSRLESHKEEEGELRLVWMRRERLSHAAQRVCHGRFLTQRVDYRDSPHTRNTQHPRITMGLEE